MKTPRFIFLALVACLAALPVRAGTFQNSTTTALTSSQNPSFFGQAVTFTATVTVVPPGSGTPTGTVTFSVDGSPGSPATLVGGVATLTTSSLDPGPHTIRADYAGAEFFSPSAGTATQTVTQADTTTALSSSQNPSDLGQAVTFTATVTAIAPGSGTPTGTVTFSVDGTSGSPVTLDGSGQAAFTTSTLAPGPHTISASYSGSSNFNSSSSAPDLPHSVVSADPYVRVIATSAKDGSSMDVPGEPAGTKFTKLGLPSMDDGAVGARVSIKPAGGAEVPAIFLGDASTGSIVARGGGAAPGTAGTFASFGEPVFGEGHFAFTATLAGVPKTSDTGLWSTIGGMLDLVAGEGLPAPDADGNPLTGAVFEKIQSYALSADGEAVSFVATLKGTGVKGTNKTGVWQQRLRFDFNSNPLGPQTRLIFRTGDLFQVTTDFRDPNNLFDDIREDRPVKSLKLFVPAKTIPGQRRSYAGNDGYLFAFATFAAGREALLGWIDNGFFFFTKFLALENTTVGHPGLPSINNNGNFAMRAGLSIGAVLASNPNVKITAKNDQTILTGSGQFNIRILCQEGSAVSSTNPQTFTAFDEPAFNDNFTTAFFAKVKAPGLPASQQRVLIYDGGQQTNFEPKVIARTGTAAADLTGGVLWKDFTAMALPDSNYGPVFLATLTGPGVNAKNSIGLWATDLDGTVRLLLRTGDMVLVGGAQKTVSLITTLGAALDSPGQGRYVDLLGNVSATLTFTDGTTALVHFGMPTPAP